MKYIGFLGERISNTIYGITLLNSGKTDEPQKETPYT